MRPRVCLLCPRRGLYAYCSYCTDVVYIRGQCSFCSYVACVRRPVCRRMTAAVKCVNSYVPLAQLLLAMCKHVAKEGTIAQDRVPLNGTVAQDRPPPKVKIKPLFSPSGQTEPAVGAQILNVKRQKLKRIL